METDNPVVEPANVFYNAEATAEPIAPSAEPEANTEDQAPPVEETLEKPEVSSDELDAENGEETALYVEIDGEEHNLEDVKAWKSGHMMQSDYTKKTQALSEERKTFETERTTSSDNLLKSQAKATEMTDLLSVLVTEDDAVDWVELKEDDPERYIELKEKADKRKEALAKVQAERETPADDPAMIQAEQGKLREANPDWFTDDGKTTDTYAKDIALINNYAVNAGFSVAEFDNITQAHHMTTILKAAKYDELQAKGREIKGKRETVPVVTKPKAIKPTEKSTSMAETFYGSAKASG